MTNLSNLSASQLNKMIENTKAEIKRRENIQAAQTQIQAILKKFGLRIQDLDLKTASTLKKQKAGRKSTSKAKAPRAKSSKTKDNRAKVLPKYKNPNGTETWSGRGRLPSWVADICQSEGISVEKFKTDTRFAIGE
jgi:DNA-binding protein H-NS